MTAFRPVKQSRISEEVLSQLKEAILSGTYRPGGKLPSERELCDRFRVSRVVIREAIRALELTGFVRLRHGPSGGAFVQDLSLDHLSNAFMDLFLANKLSAPELVQVRLHVEPEVCRLAALNVDVEAAAGLERAFQEEHAETMTHEEWVTRNLEIHTLLGRACGNRYYEAILMPLLNLTREMVLVVKPSHTVIHDHAEHRRILDAVTAGDADAAAAAMRDHVSKVGASLIDLEKAYRRKRGLSKPRRPSTPRKE